MKDDVRVGPAGDRERGDPPSASGPAGGPVVADANAPASTTREELPVVGPSSGPVEAADRGGPGVAADPIAPVMVADRGGPGERALPRQDAPGARDAHGPLTRRDALKLLGVLPLVSALGAPWRWTQAEATQAAGRVAGLAVAEAAAYAPSFFTPHEYATVRLLADMVVPADERSGSASDARVAEFMDFMMGDGPEARRAAFRGGLAWLDAESQKRNGKAFVDATEPERAAILDDIAWPKKAPAAVSEGVAFFSAFRDLTAAGFFSSELGQKDLGWVGNVPVMEWKGCGDGPNRHALRGGSGEAAR